MATEAADPGFAPAKLNLALHVTGRRADGYHLLDSLVVFAAVGDRVAVAPGLGLGLTVAGPMAAGVPVDGSNLVVRAARAMDPAGQAALHLEKHLPTASGIGGGSSDAAAALRVLAAFWRCPLPDTAALLKLGADMPVCLAARPARMQGIGEALSPVPPLPAAWVVLANPGRGVPTPAIFARLTQRQNAPMGPPPATADLAGFARWLGQQRNDLQSAAEALEPGITKVLQALAAQPGCHLARMSGSGATCFGLFAAAAPAAAAAKALTRAAPEWWVRSAQILQ